jgi:hypothetical protein
MNMKYDYDYICFASQHAMNVLTNGDNFHFEMRWVVWVRLFDDARTWRKKFERQATWKENELSLVGVGLNKKDGN